MAPKETLGRKRKIEIKKLEKKSSKQVTFSKRRTGLFKKASELSVLCGAEVAIITFSPNQKPFCFGHPNVDSVLHRFLAGSEHSSIPKLTDFIPLAELNKSYDEALIKLENEKINMECVKNYGIMSDGCFWWENPIPIEKMELEELKEYSKALMELRWRVSEKIKRMCVINNIINIEEENLMAAAISSSFSSSFHVAENEIWWDFE